MFCQQTTAFFSSSYKPRFASCQRCLLNHEFYGELGGRDWITKQNTCADPWKYRTLSCCWREKEWGYIMIVTSWLGPISIVEKLSECVHNTRISGGQPKSVPTPLMFTFRELSGHVCGLYLIFLLNLTNKLKFMKTFNTSWTFLHFRD